jgi:predicted amidohydrolase
MKLWLIQFQSSLCDKRDNTERILNYIERAAEARVDLVAFPELSLTGYVCHEKYRELAEPIPGPSTQPIIDLAKKEGVYVTLGMSELGGSYIYNCIYDEGMFFKIGTDIVTFDTRLGKLGIMVCKDIFYPEIARTHAVRGALLILCLSAAPFSAPEAWFQPVGRARAIENVAWFAYANLVGVQESVTFTGGSFISNQRGEFVVSASVGDKAKEEILECEIDTGAALKARLNSTWLKEVRPDILRAAAEAAAKV